MTIDELNQLADTMGLINKLVQRKELPADKGADAVIAIGDLLGYQHYEQERDPATCA